MPVYFPAPKNQFFDPATLISLEYSPETGIHDKKILAYFIIVIHRKKTVNTAFF